MLYRYSVVHSLHQILEGHALTVEGSQNEALTGKNQSSGSTSYQNREDVCLRMKQPSQHPISAPRLRQKVETRNSP